MSKNYLYLKDGKVYVNKNDIDVLTKNITNNISETVVKKYIECGSSSYNSQSITIRGIRATGDINISTGSQQSVSISFSCYRSDQLKEFTQKNVSDLVNYIIYSSAKHVVDVVSNNGKVNINNIVDNTVKNKLTVSIFDICYNKLISIQEIDIGKINWVGDVDISDISLIALTNVYAECTQINTVSQNIISDVLNNLGISIDIDADTNPGTEIKEETGVKGETPIKKDDNNSLWIIIGIIIAAICLICMCASSALVFYSRN